MNRLIRAAKDIREGKLAIQMIVNGQVIFSCDGPISRAEYQRMNDAWQAFMDGNSDKMCALTGKSPAELQGVFLPH